MARLWPKIGAQVLESRVAQQHNDGLSLEIPRDKPECGGDIDARRETGEQAFFQTKGFTSEPKRCTFCRKANKDRRADILSDSSALR